MFKGKEAFSKQSFKLSDKALKVKEQCAELVEMYVEAAKANPWDYLGEVFMEDRLYARNFGQVLTPRWLWLTTVLRRRGLGLTLKQ